MKSGPGRVHLLTARVRDLRVSPRGFQLIAVAAVWALTLTIISGAAVRLTGSGLGCPDWPSCTRTSVVAPLQGHAWIEFGNRLINALVTVASIGALLAAVRRQPRRRDLTFLSAGLVVGLVAEVVLGALVVYSKLAPALVSIHFLLGLVFLADAVILLDRAGRPDPYPSQDGGHGIPAPAVPVVGRIQVGLSWLALAALATVATLGTVVTSTGPHGGSPTARRYGFSLHSVAQLHGTAAEVFLLITLVLLWSLSRSGAPRPVVRRAQIMFAALVAQAAVGYTQYFNRDPVGLVAVHVAGASLLVIATLRFHLGLWADPSSVPSPEAAAGSPAVLAELNSAQLQPADSLSQPS
jgi:heme a synthase